MITQNNIDEIQEEPFDGIKESGKKPPAYFNILFFGLIIWAVIFMAYYLLSGWSSHDEFQQKMDAHQARSSQIMQGGK
jgi:cytochrome c oxidase cbb3-type subunit 3